MENNLEKCFEEIKLKVASIDGWLSDRDGVALYKLARFDAPKPNIVELGSWKGKSTIWLASAIKDRGEGLVYAIDNWKGDASEKIYIDLLKGYKEENIL